MSKSTHIYTYVSIHTHTHDIYTHFYHHAYHPKLYGDMENQSRWNSYWWFIGCLKTIQISIHLSSYALLFDTYSHFLQAMCICSFFFTHSFIPLNQWRRFMFCNSCQTKKQNVILLCVWDTGVWLYECSIFCYANMTLVFRCFIVCHTNVVSLCIDFKLKTELNFYHKSITRTCIPHMQTHTHFLHFQT